MSDLNTSLKSSLRINIFFKYANLLLSIVSGVVLLPIYLKYVSVAEYGAWLAVSSIVTWFAVMDPGIANLLIQKVSCCLAEKNQRAMTAYVFSGVTVSAIIGALVGGLGYVLASDIILWLKIEDFRTDLLVKSFRVGALSTALMILSYALLGIVQGLHQSFLVGLIVVAGTIAKIAVSLGLLAEGFGFIAFANAELASAATVFICSILVLLKTSRKFCTGRWIDKTLSLEFLSLFIYSFGGRLGKIITGGLDSVMIAKFIGPEQVAIYSLTATVPRQAENLINQPVSAFRPTIAYFSSSLDNAMLSKYVGRLLSWIVWLGGWVFCGLLCLNESFVNLWVGRRGFAGQGVAFALAILFMIRVWTNSTGTIGFSLGEIKKNSSIELIYSFLLVPALVIGVSYLGLQGVAFAHVCVQLATMAWMYPKLVWLRLNWRAVELRKTLCEMGCSGASVGYAYLVSWPVDGWADFIIEGAVLTIQYFGALLLLSKKFRGELPFFKKRPPG